MVTTTPAGITESPRRSIGQILGIGFVLLVAFSLLGLLLYGMTVGGKPTGDIQISKRPAQGFTLDLYDGSNVSLAELRGKVVFVNFWASWCIPCRDEAAVLEAAARRYRDQGVVFLGVNVWDKDQDAREFLRQYGVSYPNGVDPKGEIAIDYGVAGVPESYFIDREGKLVRKFIGPLNERQITAFLDELAR